MQLAATRLQLDMSLRDFLAPLAKQYDRSNVLGSIRALPEQFVHASKDLAGFRVPAAYRTVERAVVVGMGGSGLGAHVVQTALADRLRVPMTIVQDYALPAWVDRRTLVIASSYSGTTEEVLAAYDEAKTRGARLAAITTGGLLARRAKRDHIPAYVFTPTKNPSNQPRMGTGYLTMGTLGILHAARCIRVPARDVDRAIAWLRASIERINRSTTMIPLARACADRAIICIGAEHLVGATHAIQNQAHENAKHLAFALPLPELNHHFLEGLRFPRTNRTALHAILYASDQYHPRTQRRVRATRAILERQRIPTTVVPIAGPTRFSEALACITHGATLAFTLAMLHHMDPTPIPWVNALKQRLTP